MDRISRSSKIARSGNGDNGDRLLRRKEAAAFLGVSLRWLENRKDIPVVDLAGSHSRRAMPRYREADLRALSMLTTPKDVAGRS